MDIEAEFDRTFQKVQEKTTGGVSRQSILLTSAVFTMFKVLVDMVTSSGPVRTAQPNPFALEGSNFDVG